MIGDWLAAGSGCPTTRASRPGHTTVTVSSIDGDPDRQRVVVALDGLVLDGRRPAAPGAATFARECALRLALYPAAGKRIAGLEARAAFDVRRSPSAGARIGAMLDLGRYLLDARQVAFAPGDATRARREPLTLTPSAEGRKHLDATACEAPQLAGVDLLLRTDRRRADDPVELVLVGGRATLDIRTADCPP